MAWVYLDDAFPDHPKVAAAGGDAAWLFVCGLAYIKRYATEGRIPKGQVPKLSDRKAPTRLARRLVDVGLWADDGDHYTVHDYHDWNKPQESRSAAARKAARARWGNHHHPPPPPDDPPPDASAHAPPDAEAHADALPDASESHSGGSASGRASTCPPPHTPTDALTSSDTSPPVGDPPDDDNPGQQPPHQATSDEPPAQSLDPRVGAALAVLADRDLLARLDADGQRPVGDPVSWHNTAYDRRLASHGDHLADLADDHPDATPDDLAALADPPPPPAEPDPEAERQAAELDRARRGQEHLQEVLAEPHEPDPARAAALAATARAALRTRPAPGAP